MSRSKKCRLCVEESNDYESLYDECGNATVFYAIIYKYFHSNILNMEEAKHLTVLCTKCWGHILEFQHFELSILEAQKKLEDFHTEKEIENDFPTEEYIKKEPLDMEEMEKNNKLKEWTMNEEEQATLNEIKKEDEYLEEHVEEEEEFLSEPTQSPKAEYKELLIDQEEYDSNMACRQPVDVETVDVENGIHLLFSDGCSLQDKDQMPSINDSPEIHSIPENRSNLEEHLAHAFSANIDFLQNLLETANNVADTSRPPCTNTNSFSDRLISQEISQRIPEVPNIANAPNPSQHPEFEPIRQRFMEITQMENHLKSDDVRFLESLLNIEDEVVEPPPRIVIHSNNVIGVSDTTEPTQSPPGVRKCDIHVAEDDFDDTTKPTQSLPSVRNCDIHVAEDDFDDIESLEDITSQCFLDDSSSCSVEVNTPQIEESRRRPLISVIPIQVLTTSVDNRKHVDSNKKATENAIPPNTRQRKSNSPSQDKEITSYTIISDSDSVINFIPLTSNKKEEKVSEIFKNSKNTKRKRKLRTSSRKQRETVDSSSVASSSQPLPNTTTDSCSDSKRQQRRKQKLVVREIEG
ncbi:uncharacterized protein isoform X1 [Musca autumnalis]|uniref:uncharacterized protein isoform X1 n=1 Tax=Musca autumnalis TaxID=221902 RepID=UPI003CF40AC4